MQTLDVISVNLWQILISLSNLVLLFFILKRFLYRPIRAVLEQRQGKIDRDYAAAAEAEKEAKESQRLWQEKLSSADEEAGKILSQATDQAKVRGEQMIAEAKSEADRLVRSAKAEAELERRKSADQIKQEIVEVSGALTEKMLGREIKEEDHRRLIHSFLEEMEEQNDLDR